MKLRADIASGTQRGLPRRGGYVIFAVLIVVVVLALIAYRFTESMTSEYRASVRLNDNSQVKLAAISGLHYTAAVLSDPNTFNNELAGNPFDNPTYFQEIAIPTDGTSTPIKPAYFSIQCVAMVDASTFQQKFGVIDEGGKLNINTMIALDPSGQLLYNALMQLPNMTTDVADSIVDWVDADDTPRANGAESDYYSSLPTSSAAKNGPLNSLDELLLVKGVTPYLLYGGDTNRNGVQDPGEVDATRGWSDYLTVYGRELNLSSQGVARIYLNGDDLATMQSQLATAVGPDLAAYIIASKLFPATPVASTSTATVTATSSSGTVTIAMTGASTKANTTPASTDQLNAAIQAKLTLTSTSGTRIKSLMSLIGTQISLPKPTGAAPTDPTPVATSPLNDPTKLAQLLPLLLDTATVQQAIELVPRINVNTAPYEVLMAIPGMTDTIANQILTQRATNPPPPDPGTLSAAWLVTTNTLTSTQYMAMEKYITGKTMVYRVQSIGYYKTAIGGTGNSGNSGNSGNGTGGPMMARMEAVIDTNQGSPRFLFIRDLADLENPPGFQPPNQ